MKSLFVHNKLWKIALFFTLSMALSCCSETHVDFPAVESVPMTSGSASHNFVAATDKIARVTVRLRLLIRSGGGRVHTGVCSGTLIDKEHVVTAAHCVFVHGLWKIRVEVGGDVPVQLEDGRTYSEVASVSRYAASRFFAKGYEASSGFLASDGKIRDVAVLKLSQPLNSPYEIHVPLAQQDENLNNQKLILAGYGIGGILDEPLKLRKIEKTLRKAPPERDTLHVWGLWEMISPGDSGGPVFLDKGNSLVLLGVHSYGDAFMFTGASIDLRKHGAWIKNAIKFLDIPIIPNYIPHDQNMIVRSLEP